METIIEKNNCCGCKACADICRNDAISFSSDREGFWYPEIDTNRCVDCGQCKRVCPQLHVLNKSNPIKVMAAKNRDRDILLKSSSGGVFTALAEEVLLNGGIVYGVIYNKNIQAQFCRIDKIEGLEKMRGSKYVQADSQGVYRAVLKDLEDGYQVMFVGTPCQVSAMRIMTSKYLDRILLVDFICHGVTSPRVFAEYIRYIENKRKKRIVGYFNRAKDLGWRHTEKIIFQDGKSEYTSLLSQAWRHIFHSHNCLRTSCYNCHFNHYEEREADITIGDYWGIEKHHPEFKYSEGASLVVIYTDHGKEWIGKCKKKLEIIDSQIEYCLERQPHFRGESAIPQKRIEFWREYYMKGIPYIVKKYGKCDIEMQLKHVIKRLVGRNEY